MANFKNNVPLKTDGTATDISNGYDAGTVLFVQNLSSGNVKIDFGGDAAASNRGVVLTPFSFLRRALVTTVTAFGDGGFIHVSDTE